MWPLGKEKLIYNAPSLGLQIFTKRVQAKTFPKFYSKLDKFIIIFKRTNNNKKKLRLIDHNEDFLRIILNKMMAEVLKQNNLKNSYIQMDLHLDGLIRPW